jgi:cytochrome c biogenesis protein CcdA
MLNSPVWRDRFSRWYFSLGLVLGALATAMGLLVAGSLVRLAVPVDAVVAGVVVVLFSLRELGLLKFWLPQNKRLVPEQVHRHGRFFGPLQFGFEMGTSLRTYTPSALPHAAAIVLALLASPPAAVVVGVGFGLGRGAMTIGNLNYSRDNSWDLAWLDHERWIRAALVGSFTLAAATLILPFPR